MAAVQGLVVDELKVRKAVLSGLPLTITTFTMPHEIELYIEQVLAVFLRQAGQERLQDYLAYCVRELTGNAKKANTKRVYFNEKELRLTDDAEYQRGMKTFKAETLGNIAHYLQLQKEKGLYIKLILQIKRNIIFVEVRNNVVATRTELIRIHDKLARSRQFDNMADAMAQVLDDSEGAGLGLVILVLMLKKMGLDEDCFDITGTDRETIARIIIPLDKALVENLALLAAAIVDRVNSLPQFPESILTVQKLINDPRSEIADIARKISTDPALTADLLKIVNSAQYILAKRVDNIAEAVKLVGIRGITSLLYSYGTQKILGEDTAAQRALWDHSYRTAFYAQNLARAFYRNKNLLEDAYVGGILHDMGKIIFSHVHPELLERIRGFCIEKKLPASTFEDLSAGMNHAEIGALVAEKWNFPESLVHAIRFHHDPSAAPVKNRALVEAVYLANMLCEYEAGVVSFDQFEPPVLAGFGFTSKADLDALLERFSQDLLRQNR